jgi:nucleoside-diphosphate-sugar epimerase
MSYVVVFGGSGFIGSHLIRQLSEKQNEKIISVDIRKPKIRLDKVKYVQADVRDLSQLELPDNIDRFYNLAAIHTTPGHESYEYYETNIVGALEVTKLAEKYQVKEIIFTSSISVYGPGEDRKDENSSPAPISSYGYSKLMAEKIHLAWHERNYGTQLTTVRPAVVFGPGEGGNFTRLASLMKKGFFIYPGRKDTIKSCIYVADLLSAIETARAYDSSFTLFNGAYAKRYTLENIVDAFIVSHFPKVKTLLIPRRVMVVMASLLKVVNFLDIGIHPERILKLVQSTDVYPSWLVSQGLTFDRGLENALHDWADKTNGDYQ